MGTWGQSRNRSASPGVGRQIDCEQPGHHHERVGQLFVPGVSLQRSVVSPSMSLEGAGDTA